MTKLPAIILALTCATLHAQSVSVQGSGPGSMAATGAGNVGGVATPANYGDTGKLYELQFGTVHDLEHKSGCSGG